MAERPVFLYAAVYDSPDDARADYELLLDAHAEGWVGTYDAAVLEKTADGKVHVHKREKPTQHGAWTGVAIGALAGIIFPPSVLAGAVVGGTAGGVIGHLRGGMSRSDLQELADTLDEGQAALIVIAESKVEEQLQKELTRATKLIEKQVDADAEELEKELNQAAAQT
jgi:uncharacterized membrane protein